MGELHRVVNVCLALAVAGGVVRARHDHAPCLLHEGVRDAGGNDASKHVASWRE